MLRQQQNGSQPDPTMANGFSRDAEGKTIYHHVDIGHPRAIYPPVFFFCFFPLNCVQ